MTETSVIIFSQVFGPVAIVASLWLLANQHRLRSFLEQVADNEALQFLVHIIRMVAWLFIMVMVIDTTEVINLAFKIAWAVVAVIGAVGLLFPNVSTQVLKRTMNHITGVNIALLINLFIGIGLTLLGYVL